MTSEYHCSMLGVGPRASQTPGKHFAHGASPGLQDLAGIWQPTSPLPRGMAVLPALALGDGPPFMLPPQGPLPLRSHFFLSVCGDVVCPLGRPLL